MGAKLERGVWLKNYFRLTTEQDIERDGVMEDHLKSVSDIDAKNPNSLLANLYYCGKIGLWGIDANFGYYSLSDKKNDRVGETSVRDTRTVEPVTENSNHLFAARLVADRALWLGNLKLGGELTAVRRSNEYAISGVETMGGRTSNVREQTYFTTSNTLGVEKQWLAFNLDDPREESGKRVVKYNRPMLIFNSDNTFSLGRGWQLELNSQFYSKAHFRNVRLLQHYWDLTAAVGKKWQCRNAGTLTLRLAFSDIFNTARHDAILDLGNYTLLQSNVFGESRANYTFHRVSLSLRYTFNATMSKYRGTGAGDAAKQRL